MSGQQTCQSQPLEQTWRETSTSPALFPGGARARGRFGATRPAEIRSEGNRDWLLLQITSSINDIAQCNWIPKYQKCLSPLRTHFHDGAAGAGAAGVTSRAAPRSPASLVRFGQHRPGAQSTRGLPAALPRALASGARGSKALGSGKAAGAGRRPHDRALGDAWLRAGAEAHPTVLERGGSGSVSAVCCQLFRERGRKDALGWGGAGCGCG